jgi:hypothetical protein
MASEARGIRSALDLDGSRCLAIFRLGARRPGRDNPGKQARDASNPAYGLVRGRA